MRSTAPLGALLLTLVASAAHAQRIDPPLSLAAAQSEARTHAPDAAEVEARIRAANVLLEDARRVLRNDPSIGFVYHPPALAGLDREQGFDFTLDWTIDISGSWDARAGSAEADLERAAEEGESSLRALDEAVAIAVAELALAQRTVERATRLEALAAQLVAAEDQRLAVGTGTSLERDAAELTRAGADGDLAIANGAVIRASTALARLLGRESADGLTVEDATEEPAPPPALGDLEAVVERDPRVVAARAELHAAALAGQLAERLAIPMPTISADLNWQQHEIDQRAFRGAGAGTLEAAWEEWAIVVGLSFPLPFFDHASTPAAEASARAATAEGRLGAVRADVRAELVDAHAGLVAAIGAERALAGTSGLIDRDYALIEQSLAVGTTDSMRTALALRQLAQAAMRLDAAVRDRRTAQAHWARRAPR